MNPPAYEATGLVKALREAGQHGPGADPRPVVAAADALVQAPPEVLLARRIATGTAQPTRAEFIAEGIVQVAIEDGVTLPGSQEDPHRPLRAWAIDQHLCTEADLTRVWTARALRWGQAHGWLPGEVWDNVAIFVEDHRVVSAILRSIQRGPDDTAGGSGA